MCGEKGLAGAGRVRLLGSPPRARGEGIQRRDGFIGMTDHPRVRGEKSRAARIFRAPVGSPPRARGEAPAADRIPLSRRITPACAGRRMPNLPNCVVSKDHPRVRGEKLLRVTKNAS